MTKKHILQFVPYYPPHIGGVEMVAQSIAEKWAEYSFWNSYIITSDIDVMIPNTFEKILYKNREIGYIQNGVEIFLVPSFEPVHNFPVFNIFSKQYRNILSYIKNKNEDISVITHTRFFLSSFFWALFAKKYKYAHTHIEHGSYFVKTGKAIVDTCSKIYDISLWKYSLHKARSVFSISDASGKFIRDNFWIKSTKTWYRGIDIPKNSIDKTWDVCFLFIGRLTGLKNVSALIESYKSWNFTQKLYIIWDGDERQNLEKQSAWENIEFLWSMENKKTIEFLQTRNCILINPSFQEWLPTTVIEWLMTKNVVIATNVWGTSEISQGYDLITYNVWNREVLTEKMNDALENFSTLSWESYKSVLGKFDWEKGIRELYNNI